MSLFSHLPLPADVLDVSSDTHGTASRELDFDGLVAIAAEHERSAIGRLLAGGRGSASLSGVQRRPATRPRLPSDSFLVNALPYPRISSSAPCLSPREHPSIMDELSIGSEDWEGLWVQYPEDDAPSTRSPSPPSFSAWDSALAYPTLEHHVPALGSAYTPDSPPALSPDQEPENRMQEIERARRIQECLDALSHMGVYTTLTPLPWWPSLPAELLPLAPTLSLGTEYDAPAAPEAAASGESVDGEVDCVGPGPAKRGRSEDGEGDVSTKRSRLVIACDSS
ncbi:hypothetical protein FA95DRAFT_1603919 [Auriscalpium vulgare]|uniref:Uncharacterized protein n=1 Tax=Auriscalpium vulgare TaxID=40419 RepID=A0ACB8S0E2_9AGAM|nr:hypothetical protein FA95DRAFT_1603919 [Auriscalpium vulgare]